MLRCQLHIKQTNWFSPIVDYTVCGTSKDVG